MRALMMTVSLLAAAAAPMTVQAASPMMIDEFMAVCVPGQNNPAATIAAAKGRGYAEVAVTIPAGVDTMVGLTRQVDGKMWAVVVGTLAVPAQPGAPAQTMSTCAVSGVDIGTTSADAARRWAGMPAGNMGEVKTEYFFYERNGKRTGIPDGDEAATVAALKSGGYALLQIEATATLTSVSLTNSKPAP